MPEWLVIPCVLASAFVLGWLILIQFVSAHQPFEGIITEMLMACLVLGISAMGWFALVLAELGRFSIGGLGAAWGIAVASLGMAALWRGRYTAWRPRDVIRSPDEQPWLTQFSWLPRWAEYVVLGGWLLAAVGLFFRPHEYILGGADAGVYVNVGASIARTGSILIDDPVLRDLDPGLYPAVLRAMPPDEFAPYYLLPGFYVLGLPPGQITPQFYPLHPVWQATAYGLGGLRAELLITPLWAMLGSLAVYLVVRQLCGWQIAALALIGLSLTALQAWFARYPTSEMLTQYLIWAGLWSFNAWLNGRKPLRLWGLVTGLALGSVFLTRIDTYFLLAVPVLAGLWLYRTRRSQTAHLWLFAPIVALTSHSILHGALVSASYFWNSVEHGYRLMLVPGLLLAFLGAGLWIGLERIRRAIGPADLNRLRRPVLAIAIGLVVGLAVYGWFIRPYSSELPPANPYWYGGGEIRALDHENLIRLGWYLSPIGIGLGVLGTVMWMWRPDSRTIVLLGIGLFFSVVYLWRIQANPHQVYAMRRYVPVVLPFFIAAAAYALGWLLMSRSSWLRWSGVAMTTVWLGGLAWSARGFISQVDLRGLIDQLDQFNARLSPNSVLIFNDQAPVGQGDFLGTPLRFLYGHDVFTVRDPDVLDADRFDETVRGWQAEGRRVYWIEPWTGGAAKPGYQFGQAIAVDITEQVLENVYDHKPTQIWTNQVSLKVYPVLP